MKKLVSLFLSLAVCMALAVPALAAETPYSVDFGGHEVKEESIPFYTYDFAAGQPATDLQTVKAVHMKVGETITFRRADTNVSMAMSYCILASDLPQGYTDTAPAGFEYEQFEALEQTYVIPEPLPLHEYLVTDLGTDRAIVNAGKFLIRCRILQYDPAIYSSTEVETIYVLLDDAEPTAPAAPSFADVTASDYFYDSVNWAVDKAITNGTSATTFSPSATCTQAQIITFLWRANGSPAGFDPSGLGAAPTDYYYDAVNWAVAKGIIDASFSASAPCTRAAAVTYMYRNAGSPAVSYGGKFADVAADATGSAVQWALDQGVTTGTSDITFSPSATCTRGQIVTFLYRDLA